MKGLNAEILSITNATRGHSPTVTFKITQNDGSAVSPSDLGSGLNLLMGGPTVDYAVNPIRESASGASFDGSPATYTFTGVIPPDATGTWAFSIEARRDVAVEFPPPGDDTIREAAFNPVAYASVDGSAVEERRQVVDIALCNGCHGQLAFHGGQRLNPQECVMCHNPNFTDDQDPPESLDFKRLIHRIHRGEELTQPYLDFNHVVFPGDLRDCQKCHVPGSQEVIGTPPAGWLATTTPRDWYTPMRHYATSCLGCHDTQAAAAHAFLNTAPFGEACAVCHGADAEEAVDKVHAR